MKVKIAVSLAVLLISASLNFFIMPSTQASSSITIHYIDVGQGDSIFIDTEEKDVLIDGGPGTAGTTVLNYLSNHGIMHIHFMIATHMHEDHIGGLVNVLSSALTIDEILINNQPCSTVTCTNFMTLVQSHTITIAQRGQTFQVTSTVSLTVLNPTHPLQFTSQNDNSIVIKLQAGSTSFLFTGDAETDAEQSMLNAGLNVQSNVLKVSHHGSRTATSQSFLDSVAPSYAIISAGEDNPYGHPHQETIQKLLAAGVTTYGTYKSGTIVASTDGTTITFQGSPEPIPEFQETSIILATFIIATLLIVAIIHKKRAQHRIG